MVLIAAGCGGLRLDYCFFESKLLFFFFLEVTDLFLFLSTDLELNRLLISLLEIYDLPV
jgi:hypothetical protein